MRATEGLLFSCIDRSAVFYVFVSLLFFLETIFVLAMCHVSIAFNRQASRLFSMVRIEVNQTTGFFFYQFSLFSLFFPFSIFFFFFFDSFKRKNHSWSAAVAESHESLLGQNRSKVGSVWYE